MSRTLRNLILAVILVVIVVLVERHGNLFHSTTTSTTAPPSTSTTVTPTTSTTGATTTTTVPAYTTTCRGKDFTGENVGSQGAAGTGYDIMTLTKVTPGTCVVDGYPILSFQDTQGALETGLGFDDSTNFPAPANAGATTYSVTDGSRVDVQFRYGDVAAANETCPTVAQVNVQFVLGDTSVPVRFPYPISPCASSPIGVSAFYPG